MFLENGHRSLIVRTDWLVHFEENTGPTKTCSWEQRLDYDTTYTVFGPYIFSYIFF